MAHIYVRFTSSFHRSFSSFMQLMFYNRRWRYIYIASLNNVMIKGINSRFSDKIIHMHAFNIGNRSLITNRGYTPGISTPGISTPGISTPGISIIISISTHNNITPARQTGIISNSWIGKTNSTVTKFFNGTPSSRE